MVVAVVVAAVGGWAAGSLIESPAEAAARTAAPTPSPILVPAELRALSTNVITRGTGRFGSPQTISLAASSLKGDLPRVLTAIPGEGVELDQGMVIMNVSGRPVFLFAGEVPSFRDLGPGVSGADVRQLEDGLAQAGHDPGPRDGEYDSATEQAVANLYAASGFEPVAATAPQLDALRTVEGGLIPGSQSSAGIHLPADEVLFVPALPIRVAELFLSLGETVDGPIGSVTDATIAIDSSVPVESAGLLRQGMIVLIDEPDLGIETEGVISRVAEGPGTDGVDGFHVYFEVVVQEDASNVVNSSVRLTIPIESTSEEVLVVPVSALTLGADGSSRVQRSIDDRLEQVTVEPGLSAQGLVAIEVVEGELNRGDLVVVGFASS